MNVQKHERIAQIKKLSRWLYVLVNGLFYLTWLCLPIMGIALFVNLPGEGTFSLGGALVKEAELGMMQRMVIFICITVVTVFALKLTYHLRELIRYFSQGEIFNRAAITQARKALVNGLIIFGLGIAATFAGWIYSGVQKSAFNITVDFSTIAVLVVFGLMYLLLWALEIGTDLREESELTI